MKQKYMAGTLSVLLACMLWLIPALSGAEEGFRTQMPELLRFTQTMVSEEVGRDVFDQRMYPDTVNDGIDAQLRALIDDMAARGIVSKSAGSKPREVLITREQYAAMKDSLGI